MDLGRKMSVVVQIFDSVIKMYLAGVVSVCVCLFGCRECVCAGV